MRCLLLAVGIVLLPIGAIALAGGSAASTSLTSALGLSGGGGSIMALALGKGRIIIQNYPEMLELALSEASLWSTKESKNITEPQLPVAASDSNPVSTSLESLLQEEGRHSQTQNLLFLTVFFFFFYFFPSRDNKLLQF